MRVLDENWRREFRFVCAFGGGCIGEGIMVAELG